jgi:hypothetical protein
MKPLNLREYAEALTLTDDRDFALEILDNLQFVEEAEHEELCEDIAHASEDEFKKHDPRKQIDRIGDRLNVLSEIQDMHKEYLLTGDADDLAREHCEIVLDLRNMLKLEEGADLIEAVAQLLERIPEYDL